MAMGYRSSVAVYLSDKALFMLPEDLQKDWEEYGYEENIWTLDNVKWYDSYPIVHKWEIFLEKVSTELSAEEWDFVRVGEDVGDVDSRTYSKFSAYSTYEIM